MKLLVTGATGGLGLEIVRQALNLGFETLALGRNQSMGQKLAQIGAQFIQCDLAEDEINPFFKDVDFIIHAAALSSPWGRYEEFEKANIIATRKTIAAAQNAGAKAMVFISSPSIYAREMAQIGLREIDPPATKPLNQYAQTKIMGEQMVMAANSNDFKTIILRPRAIIGKDDRVLLPRFLRLIEKGKFPAFNNGAALIEPTDVRDVARTIFLAIENAENIGGEIFNISGGKSQSLKQMIENIAKSMGRPVKFINIDYKLARPIIGVIEWLCDKLPHHPEPILTKYSLAALSFSQTFDLAKARDKLGFVPQYDAFASANQIAKDLKNG